MSDGEGAQSGTEGTQSGAGENTTGTSTTAETTTTGEGTQSGASTNTSAEAETARREAETFRERMRAADQRASKFEQELKQLRDKDLPEVEKLKRDFDDTVKERDSLKTQNQQFALQIAFLKDNSVTWHSPESALKLVDLSQVAVEEDGSVRGMKEALTALAKSNPYLVKTEPVTEAKTPPATSPGNNGSSGTSRPATKDLASRFPVMRTRIKPQ